MSSRKGDHIIETGKAACQYKCVMVEDLRIGHSKCKRIFHTLRPSVLVQRLTKGQGWNKRLPRWVWFLDCLPNIISRIPPGQLVSCFRSVLNPVLYGREFSDFFDMFRHGRVFLESLRVVAVNLSEGVCDHEVGPSDLRAMACVYQMDVKYIYKYMNTCHLINLNMGIVAFKLEFNCHMLWTIVTCFVLFRLHGIIIERHYAN